MSITRVRFEIETSQGIAELMEEAKTLMAQQMYFRVFFSSVTALGFNSAPISLLQPDYILS